MIRIRELFQNTVASNVPIGVHGATNPKTGKRVAGNTVTANCGVQEDRVSIDENHGHPPYRTGGPLCLYKLIRPTYVNGQASITGKTLPVGFNYGGGTVKVGEDWRLTYNGGFTLSLSGLPSDLGTAETYRPSGLDSHHSELDPDDLTDLGNRAYGLLRPKIEKASLTQSLAEIGSVPSMLKTTLSPFHNLWKSLGGGTGSRRKALTPDLSGAWKQVPARVSDQFLNVQFGWAPALSDLNNVISTVYNISDLMAKAVENNDRWVSRRFYEDIIESSSVVYSSQGVSSNMCNPPLNTVQVVQPNSGSLVVTLRQVTRVWYKGQFKRYRPEFDMSSYYPHPALRAAQQAATLLGLRVNPTTLYRVMPYSWLADYFGSFTSSLQRLEDEITGEVVSRSFYLMRQTFKRYEYRVKFATFDGQAHDITWYKEASVKRRVGAENAFGFSASPGGLTGMQYAILGALGTSRVGR